MLKRAFIISPASASYDDGYSNYCYAILEVTPSLLEELDQYKAALETIKDIKDLFSINFHAKQHFFCDSSLAEKFPQLNLPEEDYWNSEPIIVTDVDLSEDNLYEILGDDAIFRSALSEIKLYKICSNSLSFVVTFSSDSESGDNEYWFELDFETIKKALQEESDLTDKRELGPTDQEEFIFYDSMGFQWVFLPEEERVVLNDDHPENRKSPQGGYYATSLESALKAMKEYRYMEPQTEEDK